MDRPVLTAAARRLWRDPQTLQLGRDHRAVVLAGVDPGVRAVLAVLDGALSRSAVLATGQAAGCPPSRTSALLALLDEAGLLEDASADRAAGLEPAERDQLAADLAGLSLLGESTRDAVHHRTRAHVLVLGAGRVGTAVAALLDGAGVGIVQVHDDGPVRPHHVGVAGPAARDVGRSRGAAAADRLGGRSASRATGPPDLVVLAPAVPSALEADLAQVPAGLPHLLAEVRDTVGIVGPLVLPGRTACLRCLDLTRSDRDPGWPALAAQLSTPVRGMTACDGVLAVAVAAQACLQVLALVDGPSRPASAGGTLELAMPDWRWRRRTWALHPACGCAPRPGGRAA